MFKPVSFIAVTCVIMLLLCTKPCRAAFPPAKQPGLSMEHFDFSSMPAQTDAKFNFIMDYNAQQAPVPPSYDFRNNSKRAILGYVMTAIGGIGTLVGALMIADAEDGTPAGQQKKVLGWVILGTGTAVAITGYAMNGIQMHHTRRY